MKIREKTQEQLVEEAFKIFNGGKGLNMIYIHTNQSNKERKYDT